MNPDDKVSKFVRAVFEYFYQPVNNHHFQLIPRYRVHTAPRPIPTLPYLSKSPLTQPIGDMRRQTGARFLLTRVDDGDSFTDPNDTGQAPFHLS